MPPPEASSVANATTVETPSDFAPEDRSAEPDAARQAAGSTAASFVCPTPLPTKGRIVLGHGSGGRLSAELLQEIFLPLFSNPILNRLDDQAVLEIGGTRLAFTTDSFVVKPLFFPGGDIGSLAVHGTVNDLAMGGARPLFLSAGFILEEGLDTGVLRRVAASMAKAAADAGVSIVTGDTKVVEKGKGDGLFINTTGIGVVPDGVTLSASRVRPGDRVILSGSIGDHGIAILAQREGLEFETELMSDSASLHTLVAAMLEVSSHMPSGVSQGIRCLRSHPRWGIERIERNRRTVARRHRDRGGQDSRAGCGAGSLRDAGSRSAVCCKRRKTFGHCFAGTGGSDGGGDAVASSGRAGANHRNGA